MKKNDSSKSNIKQVIATGAMSVVLAGGLGFQTYQVHQLGDDLTKVEKKYSQTVQNLNETTSKYDSLLLTNEKVERQVDELTNDVNSLTKSNKNLQQQVKEKQSMVNSQNNEINRLRSELSTKSVTTTSANVSKKTATNSTRQTTNGGAVKAAYNMVASAYSTAENGDQYAGAQWGNKTASGTTVKQGRTIAVDNDLIPLGTKVRLTFPQGWEHLNGVYICEDTGSAIKGNRIDVYFDSIQTCIEFGNRNVNLEVLG